MTDGLHVDSGREAEEVAARLGGRSFQPGPPLQSCRLASCAWLLGCTVETCVASLPGKPR